MDGVPLIKISIEGMRETILHAFTVQQMRTERYVADSLEQFCSEENLRRIIDNEVRLAVEAALKKEIHNFFSWGDGAKLINKAAEDGLRDTLKGMLGD